MDNRYRIMGFAANHVPDAFRNMSNSVQVGRPGSGPGSGSGYATDTTLRLDFPGSFNHSLSASKGIKRKWGLVNGSMDVQTGFPFSLLLGHSPSSSDSKASSATGCTNMSSAKETDEESSMDLELDFSLHLGGEKTPVIKKVPTYSKSSMVDLELSLFSMPAESDVTTVHLSPSPVGFDSPMDDGSMSSHLEKKNPLSSIMTMPTSSVTCISGITESQQQQQRTCSTKMCQFEGCGKGARGASGLCIAHGGGRRCQKPGCHKGAEGRTAFCKAHGGGRRCEFLGCTKSSEGRTDFCIAHGGGRRCSHDGCTRAARGKSGLCIRHGGGKRCQKENCTKSAEGLSGLCISHGGGRRCQFPACTKGAQGSTMFCKAHGGGKRCTFEGCTKGAEGSTPFCKGHGGGKRCAFEGGGVCPKSVHGGTLFCVAHGGGKRCSVPGCTRSARGRTDCCVRHGGGKRCQFAGCGKSAQGSTDFCKAHGGGKRCSWGHPGSEYGNNDQVCNAFARGKTGLCASHGALVQDKRVHGGATLGTLVHEATPNQPQKMKEVVLPPCDNNISAPVMMQQQQQQPVGGGRWSRGSEGRVHGGSLIALLAAGGSGVRSNPGEGNAMPRKWI
ncbi:hypothetical protein R6Q59_003952 [Mikania micrantha]|uniref:WRKY19-like zinc finger domain-containing protein n=1 Tax=Mikania micrantha TaxID=192012 RepID=A0A5N6MPZ4_9ASTR|nr:hypothetical protein E3N88_30568 [Mikania micrantha]